MNINIIYIYQDKDTINVNVQLFYYLKTNYIQFKDKLLNYLN